ncbi:unnamed protein product [Urochloa humidicola]
MVGLMGAYWAGSTRKDQTTKYTLVLTVLVLFALYVVYTMQLVPKLWRLAVPRRARVGAGDAAPDGATPPVVPSRIDEARSSQPPQDANVARSISSARRRGSSRLAVAGVAGTEPSRMLSP